MALQSAAKPSLLLQENLRVAYGEGEGEGGFIAREGIEHSQSRQPQRCIPCHTDVVGDLARRTPAPATKAKFYWVGVFVFLITACCNPALLLHFPVFVVALCVLIVLCPFSLLLLSLFVFLLLPFVSSSLFLFSIFSAISSMLCSLLRVRG